MLEKEEGKREEEELLFSFVGVDTRPEFLMMGICQQDDLRLGIRKRTRPPLLAFTYSSDVSKTHLLIKSEVSEQNLEKGVKNQGFHSTLKVMRAKRATSL